jgi:type I restriction enzyme M protein
MFGDYSPETLQKQWLHVIKEEIESADIPNSKKATMSRPYSSIAVHPELGKSTTKYPKGVLHELIKKLNERVWPFVSVYHDFDVVGEFYGEFLKYTGGDKKALGIVLTPRHVTELFSLLPNLTIHTDQSSQINATKVLDICAGTGGFLISAMQRILRFAHTDAERKHIRRNCLIGVEQLPNMYTLAASNMILRGDGKANLYQGSCFDEPITAAVRAHKCTVGMLNPPYSQGDEDLHELVFVKHMLACLEEGGTSITIVPMSCAIAPHPLREELLKHHTLEAVMSMPEELFYPVGVITCVMVFTSGIPHETSAKKTWFGYWRADGFVKTKNRGRIDLYGCWPEIRDRWVEMFRNRKVHPGQSIAQYVTHEDEWCAEAYMESDYSNITRDEFETAVRNYAVFRLLGGTAAGSDEEIEVNIEPSDADPQGGE